MLLLDELRLELEGYRKDMEELYKILNIDVLKRIIEKIPEDFTVQIDTGKNVQQLSDKIQIDISCKKLIFNKY